MSGGWLPRGVLAALAALASPPASAAADPYGEPPPERNGFAIGAALGPSLFRGAGSSMSDLQGVGGDLNLRVGTSAGARLLWWLELQSGGYLVELTETNDTTYNALSTLTLGAQYYALPLLWFRAGVGVANFAERQGSSSGPLVEGTQRGGLGLFWGGGFDVFRRKILAVDLEMAWSAAAFSGGVVGHVAAMLGVVFY